MSSENRHIQLRSALQGLSLGEKTQEVFFVILQHHPITASEIARMIPSIPRTTVYDHVQKLEDQGLLHVRIDGNKKLFFPSLFESVVQIFEKKKEFVDECKKKLLSVEDIYLSYEKKEKKKNQGVRYLRGEIGIKQVHKEIQAAKKPVYIIGDLSAVQEVFPDVDKKDNLPELSRFQIERWSLMTVSFTAQKFIEQNFIPKSHHIRFLPKDIELDSDTFIWDGHVAIIDYTFPLNITIIDNNILYKTFLSWFHLMWKVSTDREKDVNVTNLNT